MRVMLDRSAPLYHSVSTQRTACERINSQAKALGIERPKVRNGRSVANLHTLQLARSINTSLLSTSQGDP